MKARYIGNFPPPYGGVTVKNQLLYQMLGQRLEIAYFHKPSYLPARIYQILNMLLALMSRKPLLIGISAAGGKSRLITKLLYACNRSVMKRSVYFMMGGTEAKRIADSPEEQRWYSMYRCVYVETQSMLKCLQDAGLENVRFYPNCRRRPTVPYTARDNSETPLRCVFFSLVQRMKGVDHILEAAKLLPETEFAIYGHIEEDYKAEFEKMTAELSNVSYMGVFKGTSEEVYAELAGYDVLLLPTRWKTEGVPGVLAEAKIAAIPAIVSDVCYNAELVEDGVAGIVLKENTVQALTEAICSLQENREKLLTLKAGALRSAEVFFVENYLDEIEQTLVTQ